MTDKAGDYTILDEIQEEEVVSQADYSNEREFQQQIPSEKYGDTDQNVKRRCDQGCNPCDSGICHGCQSCPEHTQKRFDNSTVDYNSDRTSGQRSGGGSSAWTIPAQEVEGRLPRQPY